MCAPLVRVGRIEIPPAAIDHRFAREALANAMLASTREESRNRVVGTANSKRVELYGWGGGVGKHADKTGTVYLCPVHISGRSTVFCRPESGEVLSVDMAVGDVIRLDDWQEHWTQDLGVIVAMFVGSFHAPRDDIAVRQLEASAAALGRGDYYGAPRVREGFRVLQDDECIAACEDDLADSEVMLLADATARNRWVQTCAACGALAVRLDRHWPYHQEANRCRRHLRDT